MSDNVGQKQVVKIGNAAGFWGDQIDAPKILAETGKLDYLTLEYLAELTLSILAHQKSKNPDAGFASDLPRTVETLVDALKAQPQLKIVTNAGGMNPSQCAREVAKVLAKHDLGEIKVAAVAGDDLMPRIDELQVAGESFENLETHEPLNALSKQVVSANAYLGCEGIVDALRKGARIVITGRVADASLVVGPAIYEFGWDMNDFDRLGRATVAGHLIECGAQSTGGIDSQWDPAESLSNVGYPIAEIDRDGNCVITKPENTAGRVTTATVAEQLVYEIGDPAHYLTPDVDADFRHVALVQVGPDRVAVSGGAGAVAPPTLKVSLAYYDGYMASGTLVIAGRNSIEKARAAGEMIRQRLKAAGIELDRFNAEVLGAGDSCGNAVNQSTTPWEVVLRVTAHDPSREALERMGRELAPLVTSGPPGVTGYTGARPRPHRVLSFWPTVVSREHMAATCEVSTASDWVHADSAEGSDE